MPVYGSKLDWAADDNEGINLTCTLEKNFVYVITDMVEAEIDTNERVIEGDIPSSVNGIVEVDEDGFVKTKNGRGRQPDHRPDYRGRGRGFRGDRGGEHRGGKFKIGRAFIRRLTNDFFRIPRTRRWRIQRQRWIQR